MCLVKVITYLKDIKIPKSKIFIGYKAFNINFITSKIYSPCFSSITSFEMNK